MTNLLFLCARSRLRSPTAEQVFASQPGVETVPDSACGASGMTRRLFVTGG